MPMLHLKRTFQARRTQVFRAWSGCLDRLPEAL
jgi:hypothetical protein